MRTIFLCLLTVSSCFASLTRTRHSFSHGSLSFSYDAVAGTLPQEEGISSMPLFFIGYFQRESTTPRPITFVFPGGPGGACGPEAICTVGPKRLLLPEEGQALLPPYALIDNPETWLLYTDLIFVDPPGTGFSAVPEEFEDILFGVDVDIAVLGIFVENALGYFSKWNAPKYLSGISYGTTRSVGVGEYLAGKGILLHGMSLLGSALDFSSLIGNPSKSLPYALQIPSFAATAWYHNRLPKELSLAEAVAQAQEFAFSRYLPALLRPMSLTEEGWERLYLEMSTLIGLPYEVVSRYQGRFDEFLYTTEFFGRERQILGGLDSRYVGDRFFVQRTCPFDDPSYKNIGGIQCAFAAYLEEDLEWDQNGADYVHFSPHILDWDFGTYDSIDLPDLAQRLQRTLIRNPSMQVLVGSGYFDLRTPFAATNYAFSLLNLPPSYWKNLSFHYYEGGHGFVFDAACLKKLQKDVKFLYSR